MLEAAHRAPVAAPRPWVLPGRVELGTFSKAEGPWNVDWAQARADAETTLRSIDFTKRDIVIWVPGTEGVGVHIDFRNAVKYLYGDGDVSLTALRYDASWELRTSLPTGLATMRLVLEGIRQRLAQLPESARPRVLLSGESQGAWIIGECAADPVVGPVITRAMLAGHPWLAAHPYKDGQDPRVRVINHPGDMIAMTINGSASVALDAMIAVRTGTLLQRLGTVAQALLANPVQGVALLHHQLRDVTTLRPYLRDPHLCQPDLPRMVHFLKTGEFDRTWEELDDEKYGRRWTH